jgi:type IV pilus assembly protein PilE
MSNMIADPARTRRQFPRRYVRGMTLIELMVVIVVAAILGSIAVSSYRGYLLRTNRSEAKMALLRVQAAQEKFFLQNNRYATDDELEDAPPDGLGIPSSTPGNFYTISLVDVTDVTYTAKAVAKNGQTQDSAACLTLTINQNGRRTPDESSGCWR